MSTRRQQAKQGDPLLDPKAMDGPVVPFAPADLFRFNDRLFLGWHVASAPWDVLGTVGCLVGGALYGVGFLYHRPLLLPPSAWAAAGTSGLIGGGAGAALGLARMAATAAKGGAAEPPWNEDGIKQRCDGLSHNFVVRIMDLSSWLGMGLAAGAVWYAGGPSKLKLSSGWLGVGQALSLGSAVGMLGAVGCVWSTRPPKDVDDDDDRSDE